jgi:hypothetical protein
MSVSVFTCAMRLDGGSAPKLFAGKELVGKGGPVFHWCGSGTEIE